MKDDKVLKIHCYKGAKDTDATVIEATKNMSLSQVRKKLTEVNFITADTNSVRYRFIVKQTPNSDNPISDLEASLDDILVPIGLETNPMCTIESIWGEDHQIVLSNILKKKSDLVGFSCDNWNNGELQVVCRLNMTDPSAKTENQNIKAFAPIMLKDVVPTNYNGAAMRFLCVCVAGSVVEFTLRSWGAVGFCYSIAPSKGTPIVRELYGTVPDGTKKNDYYTVVSRRYQDVSKTIVIEPLGQQENIDSDYKSSYGEITFTSYSVTSYKKGGKTVFSDAQPPKPKAKGDYTYPMLGSTRENMNENTFIDGNSVEPAIPVQGDESTQAFGSISDAKFAPAPLGVVTVHFMVFKTLEEALNTVQQLNSLGLNIYGE